MYSPGFLTNEVDFEDASAAVCVTNGSLTTMNGDASDSPSVDDEAESFDSLRLIASSDPPRPDSGVIKPPFIIIPSTPFFTLS